MDSVAEHHPKLVGDIIVAPPNWIFRQAYRKPITDTEVEEKVVVYYETRSKETGSCC